MKIFPCTILAPAMVTVMALSSPAWGVTVRPGDTLTGISQQHYGTPDRWEDICQENRESIGADCNLLQVGLELTLPGMGSPTNPVFGPVDLGNDWSLSEGLTLANGSVSSQVNLLHAAVYDEAADGWLVRQQGYGQQPSIEFTTDDNTSAVRIYPLRNSAAGLWAYVRVDDLEPNTRYVAAWRVVDAGNAYRVSDLTVAPSQ